jgi:hypothetical protein
MWMWAEWAKTISGGAKNWWARRQPIDALRILIPPGRHSSANESETNYLQL